MSTSAFRVICEIEPSRRPDLSRIATQVRAAAGLTTEFLVPDCHLGRPAMSSLVVADAVRREGGLSTACLNARDRNLLGVRRDALTAAACGIQRLLFVRGDAPTIGERAGDLTVRAMLEEVRAMQAEGVFVDVAPVEVGVTAALRPVPDWKLAADFVFLQVSFAIEEVLRWRDAASLDVPVYAAVMVLRSSSMALPGVTIPDDLAAAVDRDALAGIDAACRAIDTVRDHGGFAGVHLVPSGRVREVADALTAAHTRPDALDPNDAYGTW